MRTSILPLSLAILLCHVAITLSCDDPINVEEIDRATNAGRDVPAPICPDELSSSPSQTAQETGHGKDSATTATATATPMATATSSPDGYGNNTLSKENTCVFFMPPDDQATQFMCRNVCGNAVADQVLAGKTASVTCVSWIPKGQTNPVNEKVGGATTYPGKCICNEPFIDEMADDFVEALPKIAEIAVQVFVDAFEMAFEIGALLIPGVGEAVGPGIAASISAARLADWTYDATNAAKAFTTWAQGAGKLPKDMDKVFKVFNKPENESFLPGGKFTPPKGIAKGSGKPGDKGNPDVAKTPEKDDSSVDKPTKEKEDKKDDKNKKSCKKQKRGGDDDNCSDKPATSHDKSATSDGKTATSGDGTITSTIVEKSKAIPTTIAVTCDALQYGQACYHYYSAIKKDQNFNNFGCTNTHQPADRRKLTAVPNWKEQHNNGDGWKAYITKQYIFEGTHQKGEGRVPACQVDEWPPAYFRDEQNKGQVVRYLPGNVNGGVAGKWTSWCKKNDGGEGNNQFLANKKINTDLVTPKDKLSTSLDKGKNKGDADTLYETWSVEYQRATFSMAFKWEGGDLGGEPGEGNSWGLKINPCWPEAIVPQDPGWVLDIGDDWYNNHKPNPDLRGQYAIAPGQNLIDAAGAWLAKPENSHKEIVSNDPGGPKRQKSDDGQGSNKAQKQGTTPTNSRRRRRSLSLSSNGLLSIRDDDVNVTRPLTNEELNSNIEVVRCADRTCSKERRSLERNEQIDDESVLVIEGDKPRMTPPKDVEAVPTVTSSLPRQAAARLVRSIERRSASPDLPMVTKGLTDQGKRI